MKSQHNVERLYYVMHGVAILLLLTLGCSSTALAQREAWNWHFGMHRGLSFTADSVWMVPDQVFRTIEGGGSCSDYDGSLIFFTNGAYVWDALQQPVSFLPLRSFFTVTQTGLVVRRPGSMNSFHIMNQEMWHEKELGERAEYYFSLLSSIVRRQPLTRGLCIVKRDSLLTDESTEKVCAIGHENGWDVWIVMHELNGSRLRSYLLSDSGVGVDSYVLSETGARWGSGSRQFWSTDIMGCIKATPSGTLLVAARGHFLEFFRFSPATGKVTSLFTIPACDFPLGNSWTYGVEFSLNEKVLYVTTFYDAPSSEYGKSFLFQYDISVLDTARIKASCRVLDSISTPLGGYMKQYTTFGTLQMAPNGKIYGAIGRSIGPILEISKPDSLGPAAGARRTSFAFDTTGQFSLPTFPSHLFNPRRFEATGFCHGGETRFRTSEMRRNDSVRWYFNDPLGWEGLGASGDTAVHRFSTPGDHTVHMLLYNDERIDTVTQLVRIYAPPRISMPRILTTCADSTVAIRPEIVGGRPPFIYRWSPRSPFDRSDDAADTVRPGSATTYTVLVIDDNDCMAVDSVTVVPLGPSFAISERGAALCRGDSVQITCHVTDSTRNPVFAWSPSEGVSDRTSATPLLSPRESTRYTVTAVDAWGCITRDSILIQVHALPVVQLPDSVAICHGGSIALHPVVGGSAPVEAQWAPPAGLSAVDVLDVVASPVSTTTYTLTVRNSEGCVETSRITVVVHPPVQPVIEGPDTLCTGASIVLNAPEMFSSYIWRAGDGSVLGRASSLIVHQADTITLEVQDDNSCTAWTGKVIHEVRAPDPPMILQTGDTLRINPHARHLWYRDGRPIEASNTPCLPLYSSGVYEVQVWNAHGCAATSSASFFTARPVIGLRVSMPILSGYPGDRIDIPLHVQRSGPALSTVSAGIVARLRCDASVLVPIGATPMGNLAGDERVIEVQVQPPHAHAPLTTLHFIATLGARRQSRIVLDTLWSTDAIFRMEAVPGSFTLLTCEEGGERLFSDGGSMLLLQNQPNPFNAETMITYTIIEEAPVDVFIIDQLGRRIETLFLGDGVPGTYSVRFDASSLSSGVYTCFLRSGMLWKAIHLIVQK